MSAVTRQVPPVTRNDHHQHPQGQCRRLPKQRYRRAPSKQSPSDKRGLPKQTPTWGPKSSAVFDYPRPRYGSSAAARNIPEPLGERYFRCSVSDHSSVSVPETLGGRMWFIAVGVLCVLGIHSVRTVGVHGHPEQAVRTWAPNHSRWWPANQKQALPG